MGRLGWRRRRRPCRRQHPSLPPSPFSATAYSHLKDLLQDEARTDAMIREAGGVYMDFSRQNATPDTVKVRRAAAHGFGGLLKLQAFENCALARNTVGRGLLRDQLSAGPA